MILNPKANARRTALIFLLASALYIFLSGKALAAFAPDVETMERWERYKGWTYVTLVALSIYVVRRRTLESLAREFAATEKSAQALEDEVKKTAKLAEIVQGMAEACFAIDAEFRFTFVNDRCEGLLRRKREEMLGRTLWEVFPRLVGTDAERNQRRVMTERVPVTFEMFSPVAERWLDVRLFPSGAGTAAFLLDVHERKMAESNSTRLAAIVESSDDAIISKDLNGIITSWNRGAEKIFGYAAEEIVGTPIMRLIPEDRRDEETFILNRIRAGESVEHFDTKRWTKSGTLLDVSVSASPIKDASGMVVGASKVARDITERKRSEAVIRGTTDLLKAVTDGTSDAVFVKDLQGRYLLCNESGARLVGRRIEDILGKDDTALFGPEDAKLVMDYGRRVMETGVTSTEEEVLTAAGVTRTYLAMKAPYRDERGKIVGLIGISRDITIRKKAEEDLRESREKLKTALTSMTDAVFISDAAGRFVDFNDAFVTFHRFKNKDECGKTVADYPDILEVTLPNGEVAPPEQWAVSRALRGETGTNAEYALHRKDTGDKWVGSYSFSPMRDKDGAIVGSVVVARDITEQKQLEQQFLRAQRMESIGTLAGGIAHDLNNVLGPIIMALDLLKMKFPDESSAALINIIESSANHGAAMVRQVLSFGRGVDGRRMDVQLRHLVGDIEKTVNDTFLKNIQIRTSIPHDLWTVVGDPTQLHQVLMNLCVNARDAMPNGGTITISAENEVLDEHYAALNPEAKPGPYVFLKVEDTGTGMPRDVIEKIFDPFFTTKEIGKGTGLGLSTSLAIVKAHGGFFRVSSEPGQGSKFQIRLPAKTEDSTAAIKEPDAEMPRGNGQLILVVDDEDSVRRITQQTLEAAGYRVLVAADGAEAAELYVAHRTEIALVLTDMMMPVMDGPATIQVLRKINPAVRVIGASGLATESQVAKSTGLGVKHFLPKPYTASTLLAALQQVLLAEG